ncbi:MAG: hypothetical protein A2Y35_06255 [Spirochaetes bacterium GWE1_60_18]|nr:MAG: hypothetical protein A2Y35_06255 [Spirochaetes bacterium GWE1_60_18]HAP43065.1 hypothetical protein [Spirochaetaceae bacterium]HCQ88085.1 hypothetical protein [Spirochaetaceae bacterium]
MRGIVKVVEKATGFFNNLLGGEGNFDIWYSTRETRISAWGLPKNIGRSVNSPGVESDPRISKNGLELYFAELDIPPFRAGGSGGGDVWVSRRSSWSDPWGEPENLSTVNSAFTDFTPSLAANDLLLFFASNRAGGYGDFDIWVSRRTSVTAPWGQPRNAGARINTAYKDCRPYASSDGSTLYYGSCTVEGLGGMDIWQADINDISGLGR